MNYCCASFQAFKLLLTWILFHTGSFVLRSANSVDCSHHTKLEIRPACWDPSGLGGFVRLGFVSGISEKVGSCDERVEGLGEAFGLRVSIEERYTRCHCLISRCFGCVALVNWIVDEERQDCWTTLLASNRVQIYIHGQITLEFGSASALLLGASSWDLCRLFFRSYLVLGNREL